MSRKSTNSTKRSARSPGVHASWPSTVASHPGPPAPRPSVSRPSLRSSRATISRAKGTGWRKFGVATSVPSADRAGHRRGRRQCRHGGEPRRVPQGAPGEVVVGPGVVEAELLGPAPELHRVDPPVLGQDQDAEPHARRVVPHVSPRSSVWPPGLPGIRTRSTLSPRMSDDFRMLVGADRVAGGDGTYDVVNPATEAVVGQAPEASVEQVEAATAAAAEAFPAWSRTSPAERSEPPDQVGRHPGPRGRRSRAAGAGRDRRGPARGEDDAGAADDRPVPAVCTRGPRADEHPAVADRDAVDPAGPRWAAGHRGRAAPRRRGRRHHPLQLPAGQHGREGRSRPCDGQHGRREARAAGPAGRPPLRRRRRRGRDPAGRGQRAHRQRSRGRRGARRVAARRHGQLHRARRSSGSASARWPAAT